MKDKKIRWIVIISIGVVLLLSLVLAILIPNDVSCIETNFGCACSCDDDADYNGYIDACIITEHKGVKVEGNCIDCEWYPLLCGAELVREGGYDCINPIVCGFGLCTTGFVSYEPNIGADLPDSTDLPIYADNRNVVVGKDIIINEEHFELIDNNGNKTIFKTFNELVESTQLKHIKDNFFSISASKVGNLTIKYICSLESAYNFQLNSTFTVTRGFVNYIDRDFTCKSLDEIRIGSNMLELSVECRLADFFLAGDFGLGEETIYNLEFSGEVLDFRKEE